MNICFRLAKAEELDSVSYLYESVKGTNFCTWDETYPTSFEIKEDFLNSNLYLYLIDEHIVGTISVVSKNELNELDCWTTNKNSCEIARICVARKFQGNGIASDMVFRIEKILSINGYSSIHLLAAVKNIPAIKTYLNAGYHKLSQVKMFGNDFFPMEKNI